MCHLVTMARPPPPPPCDVTFFYFQKTSLFPSKNITKYKKIWFRILEQMARDNFDNPLPPPCGIWWHCPPPWPPPRVSRIIWMSLTKISCPNQTKTKVDWLKSNLLLDINALKRHIYIIKNRKFSYKVNQSINWGGKGKDSALLIKLLISVEVWKKCLRVTLLKIN